MLFSRSVILPALIALSANHAGAFAPASLGTAKNRRVVGLASPTFMAKSPVDYSFPSGDTDTDTDVNTAVDTDSAARLAYAGWCAQYNKEGSADKFAQFKNNYEAITVANVVAAKKAREGGVDRPKDLALNEYGDMTEEEYMATMAGSGSGSESGEEAAVPEEEAPQKGALESAMEATMAQSNASNALAEAADALAEEEEKLAAALGLGSVEELEQALDAMEGIDIDGSEIDTSDAQEARVRSAFLGWCKEYGKEPVESRFPTFLSNFLAMEAYANENDREMVLNKYADCTEEEYRELTSAPAAPEVSPPKEEPVVESVKVEPPKEEPKAPKPEVEAPKEEAPVAAEKPKKPAAPKKTMPAPVKEISLEEQAIALTKAAAEADAAQVATRRARDEAAAEIERTKAREALEKQEILSQKATQIPLMPTVVTKPKPPPKAVVEVVPAKAAPKKEPTTQKPKSDPFAMFGSMFGTPAKSAATPEKPVPPPKASVPEPAPVPVAPKPEAKSPAPAFGGFFDAPKPKAAAPKPAPVPVAPKPEAKSPAPAFGGFFDAPKPKAAAPKPALAPVPVAPKPEAKSPAPAFSGFFGAPKPKAAVKKVEPAPEPVKKAPSGGSGTFSLFGKSPPVKKATTGTISVKKAAEAKGTISISSPPPAPARKKSPTFSLFGSSPKPNPIPVQKGAAYTPTAKAPVKEAKAAPKVAKGTAVKKQQRSATFSLFGSGPAKTSAQPPKEPEAAPQPVRKKSPTFSLFGSSAPKTEPIAKSAPAPVKEAKKPAFNLFGGAPKPAKKQQPVAVTPPAPSPPAKKGGFFGGASTAKKTPDNAAVAPKGVPVLKQWKQVKGNAVEGRIFGSSAFKDGLTVTTSPTKKGTTFAKGTVVQTTSGSKYFLE